MVENKTNHRGLTRPSATELKKTLSEIERSSKTDPKVILKWPVEIWISCGEPFVRPELVAQKQKEKLKQRIINSKQLLDKDDHKNVNTRILPSAQSVKVNWNNSK